jgi:Mg-chelatase subunit ChlD
MNDTEFASLMGWQVAGFHNGRVTKVLLSDGKTEMPLKDPMKADIMAAIEKARAESKPAEVASIGSNAA